MPGSCYIQPQDQPYYGLDGLSGAEIETASALLDSYLLRPLGLVWKPDASGFPCYMAAAKPRLSIIVESPINAGDNVVVPVPARMQLDDQLLGDVVVLDRTNAGTVEACIVSSYQPGQITLRNVGFSHAGPVTMEFGLLVEEDRFLPDGRPSCQLSQLPIAAMVSGAGKYGYRRRSEEYQQFGAVVPNMLSIQAVFGGVPSWELFSVNATSFTSRTGEVWLPTGNFMANYTDVRLRYVAGYSYESLPEVIKIATSQITNAITNSDMPGGVIRMKAGNIEIQRAVASVLDPDMLRQVRPFRTIMV